MDTGVLSGIEDINKKQVRESTEKRPKQVELDAPKAVDQNIYLYDKTTICPCCNKEFVNRTIKQSGHKLVSQDSDLCKHYSTLFPHFYEAIVCPNCGYAALSSDFETIDKLRAKLVRDVISVKWKSRTYPDIYSADVAIERYKMALYNAHVIKAKASTKGMICLKLCWVYREIGDEQKERSFMECALKWFQEAYIHETPPVCGWDEFTLQYIIGELNRRLGDEDEALRCFGRVIISKQAPDKIRKKALDQKDLIIAGRKIDKEDAIVDSVSIEPKRNRHGLLKKLLH